MSVDWSITITAAVPSPDRCSRSQSKSMIASSQTLAGSSGTEEPPGITALRFFQPPRTPPQCLSISSLQRDRHRLLDHAGPVHVPRDREDLGAGVVRPPEAREPARRRAAGSSAPPRSTRRCSPWSGSRRALYSPGKAASAAASPCAPRGSRAAPSPRRRYRRRRRGAGRGRSPSPSPQAFRPISPAS